ncbi:hypothetical protein Rleg10DRAFT_3632 [Rhizobium leguminosarum bv. trifolii WSM2012]|nr:hypothetical protein Rleg10DRAFT_3632 [Rhizobium leguminosarum bv. trifolii WSM2012]
MVDPNNFNQLPSELNQLPRGLAHLPKEVVVQIAKDLCPYDNPHEAGVNLAHLKGTNREMHDKLFEHSEIGNFDTRLSNLVTLQRVLCEKVLPDLSDNTPEASRKLATLQIPAIQPVFKFYSSSEQSDIVNYMMSTDDRFNRTVAAVALSTNLNDVHEPSDRRRIINQALDSFADGDPSIRENGARAVARVEGHLDTTQRERFYGMLGGNFEIIEQYSQLKKEQIAWYLDERVQLPSQNLDRTIGTIGRRLQGLPTEISTPEQAVAAHHVAKLITETYNCAHNELMNFGRSRKRSSLDR